MRSRRGCATAPTTPRRAPCGFWRPRYSMRASGEHCASFVKDEVLLTILTRTNIGPVTALLSCEPRPVGHFSHGARGSRRHEASLCCLTVEATETRSCYGHAAGQLLAERHLLSSLLADRLAQSGRRHRANSPRHACYRCVHPLACW